MSRKFAQSQKAITREIGTGRLCPWQSYLFTEHGLGLAMPATNKDCKHMR
jgi:hypothetical protein